MDNKDFFFCYNRELFLHLKSKGFKHICKGRKVSSEDIFTLYKITDELDQAIQEFNNNQ